jgi:hypothetical protein
VGIDVMVKEHFDHIDAEFARGRRSGSRTLPLTSASA